MEVIKRYVITNGIYYARDANAMQLTADRHEAFEWRGDREAQSVLGTAVQRKTDHALSKDFYVREVEYYEVETTPDVSADIEVIREFIDIVRDSRERATVYEELETMYDGKQQDILHYAEMENFNAVDGYKLYKMLQSVRQNRRDVKNRRRIVNAINQLDIDISVLERLVKSFQETVYKPRQITMAEMFDK